MQQYRVGIIGGTGYSGRELIKILIKHPDLELTLVTSRAEKNKPVSSYYPFLNKKYSHLCFSDVVIEEIVEKCDLVFFATPSGAAKDLAPVLYQKGLKIVDISGDFRLSSNEDYQKWYNYQHPYPSFLNEVSYSIPEINREQAINSNFVSNPGCYPTSTLIPVVPILESLDYSETIFMDTKSGVSGAGKKLNPAMLYGEINENFSAYKVGGIHQHIPEIEKYVQKWTEKELKVVFTPHLVPMERGMLSTIYFPNMNQEDADKARTILEEKYKNEIFVSVRELGDFPKTAHVAHTNQCHIGTAYDERTNTFIILSVIDNLLKGASGQAVQNMNLMLNFAEETGLC